jgi:hypothetical protein
MVYLYVYYTIVPEKLSEAQHLITLLVESIYTSIGVRAQILKRFNDTYTWIEIYALAKESPLIPQLNAILAQASQDCDLSACLSKPRTLECFIGSN